MVNTNHEIVTQKWKRKSFLPLQNLNHGPLELKASVQPMSYHDPLFKQSFHCKIQIFKLYEF